jgi:CSLREA domain-containing protein
MPRTLTLTRNNAGRRRRNLFLMLVGLTLLALCVPGLYQPHAHAATNFNVNSTGDSADSNLSDNVCNDGGGNCTLRAAIQQANATAGTDTINITANGTINLTGALPNITTDMSINGPGAKLLTVRRDTGGDYRIFTVSTGAAVVNISGLTLTNGRTPDGEGGFSDAGNGGGIFNAGTLKLSAVSVSGNLTGDGTFTYYWRGGDGGGIYNTGTLDLVGVTVSGNRTGSSNQQSAAGRMPIGGAGGGIFNSGTAYVTNSTVSGNRTGVGLIQGQTGDVGSGTGAANVGSMIFTHSTVVLNTSGNFSGGIAAGIDCEPFFSHSPGIATLSNSIVAGNRQSDINGPIYSQGNNIIQEPAFATVSGDTSTNFNGIDPKLSPLQENGGPTLTHAPLPGSVAINTANNAFTKDQNNIPLTTDQRGLPRTVGGIADIGAVEVNYQIAATAGTPQSATANTDFASPLQATLTESGRPVQGVTVTFTAPAGGAGGDFPGGNTAVTDANGQAAVAFRANATVGGYNVTANITPALAAPAVFSLTNGKGQSSTGVVSSANPSAFGQSVTFTATVSSTAAGTPTGTVQFEIDGTNVGGPVSLVGGVATFTTSSLGVGSHVVKVTYGGDSNFEASAGTLAVGQLVGSFIEFSQSSYTAAEGASLTVTVRRTGDATLPASVDYSTDDGGAPSVVVPCSSVTGIALDRCDFTKALGTLHFAAGETEKTFVVLISDDSYVEGPETAHLKLSNPSVGSTLVLNSNVPFTINDDSPESSGNPSDDDEKFVTQQYRDFLNRDPDAAGLAFWKGQMTSCGADAQCREVRRINVSAAFFLSIEFQQTGNLVYKMYKTGFGNLASKPVAVQRTNFIADTQQIQSTPSQVIVGQGNWQAQLEANKTTFAQEFIQRPAFQSAHGSQTVTQYVDSLFANAGVTPTGVERNAAIGAFGGGGVVGHAATLRSVADSASVSTKTFNESFVLMQFFGYLQRDPDAAPDTNFAGYNFWLSKLNSFNGDFIKAEMVKAFISSDEYRHRFGQ